jgi:hypothetical protein
MKHLLAVVLCFAIPVALYAGENSYKVRYDGGSLPDTKAGTDVKMYIDSNQVRLMKDSTVLATIPASAVTEITYGQDVHRRVGTVGTAVAVGVFTLGAGALTALSKSKKHFVGLTWANGDQKGGLAMQCDKNDDLTIALGANPCHRSSANRMQRSKALHGEKVDR